MAFVGRKPTNAPLTSDDIPNGIISAADLASGISGLITWQSIVTASTLTAVAGRGYWINTTSNACTVTLPASASAGDTIILVDYARTWGTNAVTINQNSLNFQGSSSINPIYNTSGQSVTLIYSGATQGWIPTSDDDVTFETPPNNIEFLVVAGGGGGGSIIGGGGGAGGYRTSTQLSSTSGVAITVTVGDGGTGGTNSTNSTSGSASSISGTGFTTISSAGGGGGGGQNNATAGTAGGSGGGASWKDSDPAVYGGNGNTPSTSPVQGYKGGDNLGVSAALGGDAGAGGGGAGAAGGNVVTRYVGGNGGVGVANSITGTSVYYAGGGGGAARDGSGYVVGTGGLGGGGNGGAYNSTTATSGTANTGGGGGGSGLSGSTAGGGGKGIVILKILTIYYSGTTTGSPTVTTSGDYKVLTFTGSGSYTT
jgi:hypothetical protein